MELQMNIERASRLSMFELLAQCPSESMTPVLRLIEKAPRAKANLITGETGTGKELVARAIHERSGRKGPFIVVNCGNMNPGIMGSELFGHERGAFTDARERHVGYCEEADGGTLFLDEIGEMPIGFQPRLLRAVQYRSFNRVGGTTAVKSNFLLIAATNRNPATLVAEKILREDLFFRLNAFPIPVPPLRERQADIIPLAEFFVSASSRPDIEIDSKTREELRRYAWPGNVRELENVIERGTLLLDDDESVLLPEHLPFFSNSGIAPGTAAQSREEVILGLFKGMGLADAVEEAEKILVAEAMREAGGSVSKAAKALRIDRTPLRNCLRKYDIR